MAGLSSVKSSVSCSSCSSSFSSAAATTAAVDPNGFKTGGLLLPSPSVIVIGAGISGVSAARALSNSFIRVDPFGVQRSYWWSCSYELLIRVAGLIWESHG